MGTVNRRPYETATVLDQSFLDDCHDNLVNQLELVVEVDSPIGVLYLSDRNKYVGSTFYEARLNFPVITRTLGDFLSPTLEFSQLQIEINNADGYFNDILPSGDDYSGWIGRSIVVKLGLRDVISTYKEIFRGRVTDQGGFQRSIRSFVLIARNEFDKINVDFPKAVFKSTTFPYIGEYENAIVPIIYGDWTTNVQPNAASIPAYVVNNADPALEAGTAVLDFIISDNVNTYFDTASVFLLRQENFYIFTSADVTGVVDNRAFQLKQSGCGGVTLIDGATYTYKSGDKFFVKVKGKDLGAYDDNIVSQAKDILLTYTSLVSGDFDTSWNTFRDKSTPTVSAISTFKSRIWIQEIQQTLSYVLSMLEQVRLEAFIDRNLKIKINSLHFDNFQSSPSLSVNNWDIESNSFSPKIDDRNNFNRAKGSFNYLPNRNENYQETKVARNSAAITQAGKEISKKIVFPNLYNTTVVENQLIEILKLSSAYMEVINFTATWRMLLIDLGDFVKLNVKIQGTQFVNVPAMVRDISYDPSGVKIPLKLWSFQMLPFPGYNPGYAGIVGGSTATITWE